MSKVEGTGVNKWVTNTITSITAEPRWRRRESSSRFCASSPKSTSIASRPEPRTARTGERKTTAGPRHRRQTRLVLLNVVFCASSTDGKALRGHSPSSLRFGDNLKEQYCSELQDCDVLEGKGRLAGGSLERGLERLPEMWQLD